MPKIDPPSLLDRLTSAVHNITTLEVTTRVGEVNVTLQAGQKPRVTISDGASPALYTRVDLLDADTLNTIPPALLDSAHADLRSFHQRSVSDAQNMVQTRLEFIERLARWATGDAGDVLKQATTSTDNSSKTT